MRSIVLFKEQVTEKSFDFPKNERLVSGKPERCTQNHFANDSGEVFAGVWSSEVGSWRIEMGASEDEFFFVTHGRCRLTDDVGNVFECAAGESLVIPAGFKGVFEVVEALTKHYVIVERKV